MREDLAAVRSGWQPRNPRDPSEPAKLGDMTVAHGRIFAYIRDIVAEEAAKLCDKKRRTLCTFNEEEAVCGALAKGIRAMKGSP